MEFTQNQRLTPTMLCFTEWMRVPVPAPVSLLNPGRRVVCEPFVSLLILRVAAFDR